MRPDGVAAVDHPAPGSLLRSHPNGPKPREADLGGVVAALLGELDNAGDLRARFGASGQNDAQLVADAYRRHGSEFLPGLRGRFALVIRDGREGKLLAARDPMGVHPLFYAETAKGTLEFADSTETLLAHRGVPPTLNRVALAEYVRMHWPHQSETYFEAIRRIPPGHVLEASGGERRVRRYWDPSPTERSVDWIGKDDLDRFEELLEGAVARSLNGRPAGIFLSGGLDSVSVAGVAVDLCRREGLDDPWALSLAFPDADANEEQVQRGVARDLGLRQVLLDFNEAVGPDGLLSSAAAVSASWPAPLLNTWYPAYRTLAQEGADRGCKVILTGSGGDEWLGVSPYIAADLLRAGDLFGLWRVWRSTNRSFPLPRLTVLRTIAWTFGARPLVAAAAEAARPELLRARRRRRATDGMPPWFAPDESLRTEILDRVGSDSLRPKGRGFYLSEMRRALDHAVVSMEMEENFEIGRRAGLPYASPYWDADLVDFLFRTPPELLSEGGRSKGLVRRLLNHRFPQLGFELQRKVLASNFFARVMMREAAGIWEELGGTRELDRLGIVEATQIESGLHNAIQSGDNTRITQMWHVLNLESWVRSYVRERG
jgi:asparagine synthase (glutamine-hydrolysing)